MSWSGSGRVRLVSTAMGYVASRAVMERGDKTSRKRSRGDEGLVSGTERDSSRPARDASTVGMSELSEGIEHP
jgi:hypothetical protein